MDWGKGGGRGHDYLRKIVKYDSVVQSKLFDKQGDYIRYWVPELRSLPREYIHTPWRLTKEDMKKYSVMMGDYGEDGVDYFYAPREVSGDDGSRGPKARRRLGGAASKLQQDEHRLQDWQYRRGFGTAALSFDSGCVGCVAGGSPSYAVLDDSCGAADATNHWFDEWRQRLDEWWIAAPHTDKFGPCLGALVLHIASRLEAMLRTLGANGGLPPQHVGSECDWVAEEAEKMHLPDFPQLPSKFQMPPVIPIPRLLPDSWNVHSRLEPHQQEPHAAALTAVTNAATGFAPQESKRFSVVALGAGAAIGVSVLLSMATSDLVLRGVTGRGSGARKRLVLRLRPDLAR